MEMKKSLTPDELMSQAIEIADGIENFIIYYSLKDYGCSRVTSKMVTLTKSCLALHYMGLPINTNMLSGVTGDEPTRIIVKLHRLGDNNVLTLIRRNRKLLNYLMNPAYLELVRLPHAEMMRGSQ